MTQPSNSPSPPSAPDETDKEFERFYRHPLVAGALEHIRADDDLLRALLKATFTEGAKYATDRCEASGHHG